MEIENKEEFKTLLEGLKEKCEDFVDNYDELIEELEADDTEVLDVHLMGLTSELDQINEKF